MVWSIVWIGIVYISLGVGGTILEACFAIGWSRLLNNVSYYSCGVCRNILLNCVVVGMFVHLDQYGFVKNHYICYIHVQITSFLV